MESDQQGSSQHYQILDRLGKGGMGEVYLARDAILGRRVALKFLNKERQQDEAARHSFIGEAKIAASLDHPYICQVYEVGHADEHDFIAMEYLEGRTLRARLLEGSLGIRSAVACACEIAEALAHAHSKGITHRDLKPANIMLTAAGHVKIMDFGLARRSRRPEAERGPDSAAATVSTSPGTVVGTPLYMSPEQLRGNPADSRSDIFAFGLVFYEMLTGFHPFKRENAVLTGNAILHDPPLPMKSEGEEFPELLRHIARKMLAKEPERRYQSAHEIGLDLQGLKETSPDSLSGRNVWNRPWYGSRVALGLFGLILTVMATLFYYYYRHRPPPAPVLTEELLVDWPANEGEARISPDGKWYTFLSDQGGETSLWRVNAGGGTPEKVEVNGTPVSHAWSPDGSRLASWVRTTEGSQLEEVPALFRGSPTVPLTLNALDPIARKDLSLSSPEVLCWIDDHIYLKGQEEIWRFHPGARAIEKITGAVGLRMKSVSIRADEKKIVFDAQDDIFMADLDGGNLQRLTEDPWRDFNPHWIRRGNAWRVIFSSNRRGQLDLWELSPGSQSPDLLTGRGYDEVRIEDCAADGSQVIAKVIRDEANLYCYDPQTRRPTPLPAGALSDFAPTLSANANRMAFQRIKKQLTQGSRLIDTEILLAELGDRPETGMWDIITPGSLRSIIQEGSAPLLSPDGRWLAYLIHRPSDPALELHLKNLATSREELISGNIYMDELSDVPLDWGPDNIVWSADGSGLYFVEQSRNGVTTLIRLDLGAAGDLTHPTTPIITAAGGDRILDPRPSADKSRLAYSVLQGGAAPKFQIRSHDLVSGQDQILLSEPATYRRLYCSGWFGASVLALRTHTTGRRGDTSGRVEILKIDPGRPAVEIGTFGRAYGQTALLDPASASLFVTVVESEVANIAAFSLSSRQVTKWTDNQRADIVFTGLQVCPSGRLFYSQQKHVSDLYRMRFER